MKTIKISYAELYHKQPLPSCLCTENLSILIHNQTFSHLFFPNCLPNDKKNLKSLLEIKEGKQLQRILKDVKEKSLLKVHGNGREFLFKKGHTAFFFQLQGNTYRTEIAYVAESKVFFLQFVCEMRDANISKLQIQMYEHIIQNSTDAVFCADLSGNILFANQAAEEMYMYSTEEILGKNIEFLFSDTDLDAKKIIKSLGDCGHYNGKAQHKRGDASLFPCNFRLHFVFNERREAIGLSLICQKNATTFPALKDAKNIFSPEMLPEKEAKKKTLPALANSTQMERLRIYESIIDNNWDSIIFSDLSGKILFSNPSTHKMYGYSDMELTGKNIDIFNPPKATHIAKLVKGLKDFGGWSGEVLHKRKDGSVFDVLLTISMIFNQEGHPFALLSTCKDISERIRAEKEAQTKNRQILEMKDRFLEELEVQVKERTQELAQEQEKSDRLLLNILPEEIAQELKNHGKAKPRYYEKVSILFADFVSFTKITESLSPQDLITQLGFFFKEFDRIAEEHNMEKIKTIGDAYMAAAGLPIPNGCHARDTLLAAQKMQALVREAGRLWQDGEGNPVWRLRIGVHSGPVIAGVVGSRKFAYDIWGDSVNIASRMESNSKAGQINVSRSTMELTKDKFSFEYRGKIEAKNKGAIEMFYLSL